jgi:hypothetical protein
MTPLFGHFKHMILYPNDIAILLEALMTWFILGYLPLRSRHRYGTITYH